MLKFKKVLLLRRKIDAVLLAAAAATFPPYLPLPVAIAGLFGILGIYVAFSSRARLKEQVFSASGFVILYCCWSLLLMTYRGDIGTGNRQLGFMALLLGLSFIGPGLCLVRQPLRTLVLGTRIGSYLAFLLAIAMHFYFAAHMERYDGGGNAAIFALLVALGAVTATIQIDRAPRYLPNGIIYLALSAFPIFISETRAVLVLLPFLFLLEFFMISLGWKRNVRNIGYAAVMLSLAVLVALPPVQHLIADRFVSIYDYYVYGSNQKDISGGIRLTMWRSAATVISEHPIAGVGIMDMFVYLKAAAGPDAGLIEGFKHVHNFIIQELLANGVIGLMLMISIMLSFLWTVMRNAPQNSMKRAAVYFFAIIFAFGLLHDPFYHELCMSTTMLFIGVYMAQFRRWRRLTPLASRTV